MRVLLPGGPSLSPWGSGPVPITSTLPGPSMSYVTAHPFLPAARQLPWTAPSVAPAMKPRAKMLKTMTSGSAAIRTPAMTML